MSGTSKVVERVGRLLRGGRNARAAAPSGKPAEVPEGWQVGPPDFVGVGTARSGTTWWDELIHEHPAVRRTATVPKEVHFFDRFWDGSWSDAEIGRYHGFFARPPGSKAGEWTPGYMVDFWVPALLRRAAPDARLLVMLRDPVERFRSGVTLTESRPNLSWTPRAAANGGFQRGCYADQLMRLWTVFPRDQVIILLYEECVADPRRQLRRTFEFLGLDPAAADRIDVHRRVNESRTAKVVLSREQRAALARAYAVENARLADAVPELDLSRWTTAT